jgi:hypothetical protein
VVVFIGVHAGMAIKIGQPEASIFGFSWNFVDGSTFFVDVSTNFTDFSLNLSIKLVKYSLDTTTDSYDF